MTRRAATNLLSDEALKPISLLAEALEQQRAPVVLPNTIAPETLKNWMHEFVNANWQTFATKWNKEFQRMESEQDALLVDIKRDAAERLDRVASELQATVDQVPALTAKVDQALRTVERIGDETREMRGDLDVTMRSTATLEELIGELADQVRQIREMYTADVPRLKSDVRDLRAAFEKFAGEELPKLIDRSVKMALDAEVKRLNVASASEVKKLSDELGKTLDAIRAEMLAEITKRVSAAQEAVAASAISPLEALRNRIAGKG